MSDASSFTVAQDIFRPPFPSTNITVKVVHLAALTRNVITDCLGSITGMGGIGVAPVYGAKCVLTTLALASSDKVLVVKLGPQATGIKNSNGGGKAKRRRGRELLTEILLSLNLTKYAFQMDILVTSLYLDLGMRLCNGVDLLDVLSQGASRRSRAAIFNVLGGEAGLFKDDVAALFQGEEHVRGTTVKQNALQAWAAGCTHTIGGASLLSAPRIETSAMNEHRLDAFAKLVRDARLLEETKPNTVRNEIASDYSYDKGKLQVNSTRFKTRVRDSGPEQSIIITTEGQEAFVSGKVQRVDGRAVEISLNGPLLPGVITVNTVGKDALNSAETQRVNIIVKALQRQSSIADRPFFQAIWLPREAPDWPLGPVSSRLGTDVEYPRPLNLSQELAVMDILSDKPVSVIHGPPGTGKTTVIAAVVTSIRADPRAREERYVWLVAQSNVAVKNIAEKLAAVDFLKFKLIVSRDFHYDWHEHLYNKVAPNLIRSDELNDDIVAMERLILDSKVILCTLSMLSNFRIAPITRMVPLQTVIVDEASQVEVGAYLPMISTYSDSLRKLVFIGDNKQLAPYGQSEVTGLQSVFEREHLRENAVFLDTQWMPRQLGTFISKSVYGSKLKTIHSIDSPCCRFLDVSKGREEKQGSSWINAAETRRVIEEATTCYNQGKSYRLITPYDAQRGLLESELKAAKIPWEDKVFCVDSFQGNEDDYIILSVVRTERIGFLAEPRRVNVMLTRCKRGLVVCANRGFIEGVARNSLVGQLAITLGHQAWR
ncbi:unnamed protein product [Mycena citricolor]|uniref:DNA2/NAM7 helicase-like C-terminal domain-containing protein n=1 Tax=Mycena citricolor TaxID=2018698 RepID=A0AAD2JY52_9AGAR|nr:unnamed protein product [Mycena citricolor]